MWNLRQTRWELLIQNIILVFFAFWIEHRLHRADEPLPPLSFLSQNVCACVSIFYSSLYIQLLSGSIEQSKWLDGMIWSHSSQPTQNSVHGAAVTSISVTRPFVNNQHVNRQHQSVGHQKASSHSNKEWKPKSSQQKQSSGPGVNYWNTIKIFSPPADAVKNLEAESVQSPSLIDISVW